MGMFDYIKCEVQLPGYSFITTEEFQTKSFDNLMQHYVITVKGELYRELWDYDWVDEPTHFLGGYERKIPESYRREYLTDLHGDVIFYTGRRPENGKWYDYFARFTEGKLTRIWMKESGVW